MADFPTIEEVLIVFVVIHILIGTHQFIYYPFVNRYLQKQVFPDKSYSVSLIVPVKYDSSTLHDNLKSMCVQHYQHYEVIFVSETEEDSGYGVIRKVIDELSNSSETTAKKIRYVRAGPLESLRMIAKSHNIIKGLEHAKGKVYLFTDSDVYHPPNWIQEMVNPLGEIVRGKKVSASTAIFFIDPEGFLGIFPSLSTNAAAFISSFTRKNQDLPVYASGASTAIFSKDFHESNIIGAWKKSFNDDLVLASTLVDKGGHIFNVRRLPTRPTERFDSFKGMNRKMVRWMLTVIHYTHPRYHRNILIHGISNLQFQTFMNVLLILAVPHLFGFLELDWSIVFMLLGITFVYNVITRLIIAILIHERNVYPYLILAPISQYFWGWYFLIAMLFLKRFQWGGRVYTLNKRFGRLVDDVESDVNTKSIDYDI